MMGPRSDQTCSLGLSDSESESAMTLTESQCRDVDRTKNHIRLVNDLILWSQSSISFHFLVLLSTFLSSFSELSDLKDQVSSATVTPKIPNQTAASPQTSHGSS